MIEYFIENLSTIIITAIIIVIITAIILNMIREKKKGKCIGCDLNCTGCSKYENDRD